jgi:Tfp pilus assembly protein PilN
MDDGCRYVLAVFGDRSMKHPFDDFLPPVMHEEREDKRVIRIGIVLVAVVSIATAAAFATTLSGWRGLLQNRGSVAMRWDDATTRVQALVRAQKMMQDSIEVATQLEHFVDGVPRSLLLWELTQLLPSQSILNDIRLETRTRMTEDQLEERKELITLLGIAPNDASISAYIESLSDSSYFSNVSLLYAQQEGVTTKRNFSMQLEVSTHATFSMESGQ